MPVDPNYQANTDIPGGFGGPLLNRLRNPGVLEDVSRGGLFGNSFQPHAVADLNSRVASGELTQEQANAQWAQMREAEAEAARGRDTSALQFQQHGLTSIGMMGLGGLLGGGGGAANAAARIGMTPNPGATGVPGGSMSQGNMGLTNMLLLSLMSGLGGAQTHAAPASPPSDLFGGQNQFSANPLSQEVYGGIAPIPLDLQTVLSRLSPR